MSQAYQGSVTFLIYLEAYVSICMVTRTRTRMWLDLSTGILEKTGAASLVFGRILQLFFEYIQVYCFQSFVIINFFYASPHHPTAKPPIKKIIWDASQAAASALSSPLGSTSSTSQLQQQHSPPPLIPQRPLPTQGRARGLRRGMPTRGRGNQYTWGPGQFPPRGRGGRGGPHKGY